MYFWNIFNRSMQTTSQRMQLRNCPRLTYVINNLVRNRTQHSHSRRCGCISANILRCLHTEIKAENFFGVHVTAIFASWNILKTEILSRGQLKAMTWCVAGHSAVFLKLITRQGSAMEFFPQAFMHLFILQNGVDLTANTMHFRPHILQMQ